MKSVAAIFLLCLLSSLASADPAAERRQQAHSHYIAGEEHHARAEYDAAIADYRAAYALYPLSEMLFNVAQAYRMKGDKAKALDYYQRYIDREPSGRVSGQALKQIDQLTKDLATAKEAHATDEPLPAPTPRPVHVLAAPPVIAAAVVEPSRAKPAPQPRRHSAKWIALGVGVTGLALVATGAGLLGSIGSNVDQLHQNCSPGCNPSQVAPLATRADAGYALLAIGGVAAAAGAVGFGVALRAQHREAHAWLLPAAGGLAVGGEF